MPPANSTRQPVDPILLTAARITTYREHSLLTGASGFFYDSETKLFLVTSRHVLCDELSGHAPDRIEIELHVDQTNAAMTEQLSIPLYRDDMPLWREVSDSAGTVDVAAIEIERSLLPDQAVLRPFNQHHLADPSESKVSVGTTVLIVGFPLGFHDTLHSLPVARHAIVASSYGLRFQGEGYFLTDGRTHRGSSGGPIVASMPHFEELARNLPWMLVGVHSARLDVGTRDKALDEALGLNCGWYPDVILALTRDDDA